ASGLQPLRQVPHARRQALDLFEVGRRELLQRPLPLSGQAKADDPAVSGVLLAFDQPRLGRPVHEAHRAVVPQHEIAGDVADGRPTIAVVPAHGEQELVLGRRQPCLLRLLLAPMQKAPQPGAKLQKPPVIGVFQIVVHGPQCSAWKRRATIDRVAIQRQIPLHMGRMNIDVTDATSHPQPHRDELADFSTDRRVLVLSGLAVGIGVAAALVAYALVWLVAVITNLAYYQRFSSHFVSPAGNHLGGWAVLVPMIGGLVIGLMARYGSEKIRGHGIPEALEAILIGRSRVEPKVAVLKPVSSALSIGTGGPFGAEGPIIMTGGAVGSLIAQLFHLSSAERKTLLVAGAAAGMAAIFATPMAAVLLAVELLLFEWKPRSFIPVAVASVVAALLRVPF